MPVEQLVYLVPGHAPQAAAACKPLPPSASDLVAEALQTFDVPRATIVCAVAPGRPSEIVLLRLDWQAPVVLHQSCSDFSVRAMGKHLWRTLARAFDAKKCFLRASRGTLPRTRWETELCWKCYSLGV